jgi:tight adherence protein B
VVAPAPEALSAAIAAFLAVTLGTISVALLWQWARDQRRGTVVRRQLATVQNASAVGEGALLRGKRRESLDPLVAVAHRFGWAGTIEAMLVQAAMTWDVGTFMVLSMGSALAFLMFTLLLFGSPVISVAAAVVGGLGPWLYVRDRARRRLNDFEEKLPEALDLLARAVRAGHPIVSGIKIVADEAPEPVASEFQRAFEEQRFGLPFDDSMVSLASRMPLIDLQMLVTAILVQREVGGNLAEVLDNLGEVIRQRFTVRRQLRTHTAQGRLSGYILAALPIVVGGIIFLINRDYMMILFEQPMGHLLLGIAVTLQLMGFLWIRRIVDIEI